MTRTRRKPAAAPAAAPARAETITQHPGDRVRRLRAERGWSLQMLAGASGVSRSMLSQIEREEANPTLAVTLRIAQAFGMTLGDLVQVPDASSSITVIRADDRAYHYRSDRHCRIRTLSPLNLEKDVEFYEVQLQPGGALRSVERWAGLERRRSHRRPRHQSACRRMPARSRLSASRRLRRLSGCRASACSRPTALQW